MGVVMSGPRERARKHLKTLRDTAVAATAGLAACTGAAAAGGGGPVGYGVVDPMPSPAQCATIGPGQLASMVYPSTTWIDDGSGVLKIQLSMDISWQIAEPGRFEGSATVNGGTLKTTSHGPTRSLVLEITPKPGITVVKVEIPMSCGGPVETGRWQLDWTGTTPKAGDYLNATALPAPPAPTPDVPPPSDGTIPEVAPPK
jgi:hypothetical protein